MSSQMPLHDAMLKVLEGRGWMLLEDVAAEIAAHGWYTRRDGSSADGKQLHRRAVQSNGRYVHLFEVNEGMIRPRRSTDIGRVVPPKRGTVAGESTAVLPGPSGDRGRQVPRDAGPTPEVDSIVLDAIKELSRVAVRLGRAPRVLPSTPGLYAIYGDREAWRDLGLKPIEESSPLYVGKSESDIGHRCAKEHFAKTGMSTARRSFAALLRERLNLRATPRTLSNPESFSTFGLEKESDQRLSEWMLARLSATGWSHRTNAHLAEIESGVLRNLLPRLNLQGMPSCDWTRQLSLARKVLADEARDWARRRGHKL